MPFSQTTISSGPYTPNGITTNFPFFFMALSDEEVQVVSVADIDGTETILTTGFDVLDVGVPEGGLVVFTLPPTQDGRTITIRSVPNFSQEIDFENQGSYNPRSINLGLDRAAQRDLYLLKLIEQGGITTGGGGPTTSTVTWASIQGKPDVSVVGHTHDATEIVSGLLNSARIPSLDASKIGTGTFSTTRIPSLDASKITSGVLDPARLPAQSTGVVSSGDIADLTAPQQAVIVEGTLVTTTDGQRWVYSGTGSKVLEASYVNIGDTTADWATLSNKPADIVSFAALTGIADRLPYFSGVDTLSLTNFTATGRALVALGSQGAAIAYTSPLTTKGDIYGYGAAPARLPVGTNGQVLTADSAQTLGVKWANPAAGTGGNEANFVNLFSGNPDGVTNNDAAIAAAEASAYDYIYLPEGQYMMTTSLLTLQKTYTGPGTLREGATGALKAGPHYGRYGADVHPVNDQRSVYGFSENLRFSNTAYKRIAPGTRKNFDRYLVTGGNPNGYSLYFWAPSTPYFTNLVCEGGWSGSSGYTTTAITAGVHTSVSVRSGVVGWNVGDTIGFSSAMDGLVTETRVLTGVNTGAGTISWSGPLTNTYPIGTTLSHGYRTMNPVYYAEFTNLGGGDAYCFCGQAIGSFTKLASQDNDYAQTATAGWGGGAVTLTANGLFGTGIELQFQDTGHDVGMIGNVYSYVRTVETAALQVMWLHDYAKMDGGGTGFAAFGLKRIDGVWVAAVGAKVGLDFTRSTASVAAIALPLGEWIGLDAQIVSPGPSNGNGNVATTIGGMGVRGHATDGTSKYIELTAGGTNTTKVRPDYLETTKFLGSSTSGVASNVKLSLSGVVGASTYFIYDSSANMVALYRANLQVATW